MLRKSLDDSGLRHVKIVAADDFGADYASMQSNLVRDMDLDPELSSAVDYYGLAYVYIITSSIFFSTIHCVVQAKEFLYISFQPFLELVRLPVS